MAVKRFAIPKGGAGQQRSLAQWKEFFFDREIVRKKIGSKQATALARFGAYVRRTAQTSMRYRKSASPPGTPPSAHKSKRLAALKKAGRSRNNGALLRELLLFAYDAGRKSAVVGPLGFKARGGTPVPALHEYGGSRTGAKGDSIPVKNPAGRDPRTGRFYSRGVHWVDVTGKTIRYPARPYMRPALEKTKAKFVESFRNLLTR